MMRPLSIAIVPLLLSCAGSGSGPDPIDVPAWSYEHWVWENESTQDSAIALVEDYLARDIPVGAIIIDSPWATGYNTFVWDTVRFPDPQAMIDHFHALDVRVILWTTSAVNVDVPVLYDHAAANGWLMQESEASGPKVFGWWKGDGSLIDYFNPEAVDWWHSLVDPVIAMGIDGWKCDGTDQYAIVAPFSPHLGRSVTRQEYSDAYYEDFFHHTRAILGDDRIITARPVDDLGIRTGGKFWAYAPPEINWAGWVGDQDGDFEGLISAINNLRESSELGYPAHGSDIGGFRTVDTEPLGRSKEVFLRWAGAGAFSPVMENGGGGEHRPWVFDAETEAAYRRFTKLHHALVPYIEQSVESAWRDGESAMTFPHGTNEGWLLGKDLYAAPFLTSGSSLTITFPKGRWTYLFDRSRTFETSATLTIPLTEFPAFFREDSPLTAIQTPPL